MHHQQLWCVGERRKGEGEDRERRWREGEEREKMERGRGEKEKVDRRTTNHCDRGHQFLLCRSIGCLSVSNLKSWSSAYNYGELDH